ncbi:MAG TPA: hypothetical protein VJT15_10895 [Pyrinomonadaceae bacterium]|nr:hypothetical protein [Pyrinomonadaceae bacterium]
MNSNRNKPPVAPPVYRPHGTTKAVQPKGIVNPRFTPPRPHTTPSVLQKQTNPIQPKPIPQRPFAATVRPVVQPAIGNGAGSVIQQGKPKGLKKAPQKKAVVTLTVGAKDYSGVSSGQFGHAEMQALRKFIMSFDSMAKASKALNEATKLKVRCPNQAVCGSCTIILQALGFEPRAGTSFSNSKSGGVSWGANMKVREFLTFRGLEATYQKALKAGAK